MSRDFKRKLIKLEKLENHNIFIIESFTRENHALVRVERTCLAVLNLKSFFFENIVNTNGRFEKTE